MSGPFGYITGRLARLFRRERARIRAADGNTEPDSAVPVGKRTIMKAILPRDMDGTYEWTTDSAKITLENANTDTVTVVAGENISVRDGERINLHFTANDGSFESRRHTIIRVIKVEFNSARNPIYGHDDMDNEAGQDPHLSIKKNAFALVWVRITGGGNGQMLRFTSEDATIAEIGPNDVPRRPGTEFLLTVRGRDTNKGETEIKARTFRDDGPVAATLRVDVYQNKEVEATVAKIIDSTSDDTALSRPGFDIENVQETINEWYKECVGEITLTDHAGDDEDTVDIHYDLNGNGALDLEPGATSAEQQAIIDNFNPAGQKVAIVKKLNWIFYLRTAASDGDLTINLKTAYTNVVGGNERGSMRFIVVGNQYTLGTGDDAERITVQARNGATITLASALSNDHGTDEGIMWPLSGLSGNPIWVEEGTKTEAKVRETIAHECGHSLFRWADVNFATSLMHFSSGRTETHLRFKDLPKKYDAGDESQWDSVTRT